MIGKKKKTEKNIQPDVLEAETQQGPGEGERQDLGAEFLQAGEKKAKKKLPGWVIFPVIAVLALVFFAASKLFAGDSVSQLTVVKVEKGDVKQTYNASGTVESEKTKVFYSPVNAPVKKCSAKVGTAVKKGDLLVTFDVTTLERDNRQSELNALSAKYTNEDAREQSSRAAKAAQEGKSQIADSIKEIKSQISDKKSEIKKLEKQAGSEASQASEAAKKAAKLQKKLQENQDAQSTQKALKENAERELAKLDDSDPDDQAEIQELLKTAKDATDEISRLEKEYRSLESQLNSLGSTDASGSATQLAAAKQELKSLEASLSELENSQGSSSAATGLTSGQEKNMEVSENLAELANLSTEELLEKGRKGIKAEFDGIISDVKAVEGSMATQGLELFTLVSNQDVKVRLEVSANDFDNLVEGNPAQITVGKKTYQGTLESIDKIALTNEKGNPVLHADVRIENPDEDIYIGVNAKVTMDVAEKKDVLYLPNEIVNTSTEGDFVYVIRNGKVEKQPVELGVTSDSRAEIVSGLEEGDEVVSEVSGEIQEGMKATAVLSEPEGE